METTKREQAEAVQRMQDAIEEALDRPIRLEQLADAAGYSPCHATRLFKELVGIAPSDYLRARRLTLAALKLRDSLDPVSNVAIQSAFVSHEGFTRAFAKQFGTTPEKYRRESPPIALFTPRSARQVHIHEQGEKTMSQEPIKPAPIFVRLCERPARKLVLKRGKNATEYFAYCGELGCDVWGELLSLKGALDEPLGLWLPETMRTPGTSEYVMGVEMPLDYSGPVPDGMESIELPSSRYLVFQGQPYADEAMGEAIGTVWQAIETYRPEPTGWAWDAPSAPRFQYAPMPERGYIEARPVKPLES